jgi:predicted ArsR family transcriptional regulator
VHASAPGPSPEDRHQALSNRQRVRLLELLRASGDGSDAHVLADELGLHLNTVRSHLAILERAGMVRSEPEERRVRGRPRIIYRLAGPGGPPDLGGTSAVDGYGFLAAVLVDGVATMTESPDELARRAGERWAQQHLTRDEPTGVASKDEVVDRLRRLLADLGFAPETDPDTPGVIELRRCPFRELAAEHPQVVCSAHLGVLRGVLSGTRVADDVDLLPFVTPTTCQVRVA